MERLYSSAEIAAATGLSRVRVSAIARKHGLGQLAAKRLVFTGADLDVIRARRSWWGKRPEVPPAPALFSTAQVAAQLRVSVSTVHSLARDRGIGRRIGDARVFTPDELEELRVARTSRRGQPPVHQTRYSLTAAAVKLGVPRGLVAEHVDRLGLGGGTLSEGELERIRRIVAAVLVPRALIDRTE